MLLRHECEQNVLIDFTTGNLPFQATTEGTFHYQLATTIWRLKHILVDDYSTISDYGGLTNSDNTWAFEEYRYGGRNYYRVLPIKSRDIRRGAPCNFTFIGVDPGDSTQVYRRLAYREPVDITSDNIQHEMPGTADMDYLLPATMKLIDAINDHEKTVQARQYINRVLKPAMWSENDGGEQGNSDYCIKRSF